MNISIDFDDTYTRDPIFWDRFIYTAWEFKYDVYCVTAREPLPKFKDEVYNSIGKLIGKDNCYFTDGNAKEKFMVDQGIWIDVWIDDSPKFINQSKKLFADFKGTNFPY